MLWGRKGSKDLCLDLSFDNGSGMQPKPAEDIQDLRVFVIVENHGLRDDLINPRDAKHTSNRGLTRCCV